MILVSRWQEVLVWLCLASACGCSRTEPGQSVEEQKTAEAPAEESAEPNGGDERRVDEEEEFTGAAAMRRLGASGGGYWSAHTEAGRIVMRLGQRADADGGGYVAVLRSQEGAESISRVFAITHFHMKPGQRMTMHLTPMGEHRFSRGGSAHATADASGDVIRFTKTGSKIAKYVPDGVVLRRSAARVSEEEVLLREKLERIRMASSDD